MTTNNDSCHLFHNDVLSSNQSVRFHLVKHKSNRDAIGAAVHVTCTGSKQSRLVKSGSSYLSQSELPLTFGIAHQKQMDRLMIEWPSSRIEEYKNLLTDRTYRCIEEKNITPQNGF